MIVKNHYIELEDTSLSEMARFRQIMVGIWRQQREDDKNDAEMLKYVQSTQINNIANFVSVYEVIECVKKKLGDVYPYTNFSKFIDGPMMSTPDKLGAIIYNDSQGNKKTGSVALEWNTFNGINLIAKTFQSCIDIGKYHTDFALMIFDNNLKEIAFKFTVQDFDLFITLFELLGIKYSDIGNQSVIDYYYNKIRDAKEDPNKLDVIYESFPKILFGKMEDSELFKDLHLILNDMYKFGALAGTNEDKAILQILYAIKDRKHLYTNLRDTDLLYKIYTKLHGEEIQDLLRFLTRLVAEYDQTKPTDVVYFDNSYYLFRDTHIKTDWSRGTILINNYKNVVNRNIDNDRLYIPMGQDSSVYSTPVKKITLPIYYILNKPFNPLAKLNFGTKLGELGEQIGDENTFVIALKLHNMSTKQSNWELFNAATDLLSLLSAFGALRIVLAKGAPLAARTLAGVVLAKDAAHYAMLSKGTLEKWHDNGYGWLANLWIAFSVTTDLASFGLPNLSKIAKEGNAATEFAETAEDVKEIRKVADEANRMVKAETGKDVSKMSDKEFEDFVNNTPVLLETKQKVERISSHTKYSENFKEKFHEHFDGELKFERLSKRNSTQVLGGTGGHNNAVIGKNVIIRRYLTQPIDDVPFDALISIRYSNGQWIEKTAKSTMFPKNWDIIRVKEEISLVYDKMIKSGKELKYNNDFFIENNSIGTFKIKIEFDKFGNITNSYPF